MCILQRLLDVADCPCVLQHTQSTHAVWFLQASFGWRDIQWVAGVPHVANAGCHFQGQNPTHVSVVAVNLWVNPMNLSTWPANPVVIGQLGAAGRDCFGYDGGCGLLEVGMSWCGLLCVVVSWCVVIS